MANYIFPDEKKEVKVVIPSATELMNRLLIGRGIEDQAEAELFLSPDYDSGLHDPALLNDVEKACQRIEDAIKKDERIAIFSDYDCDGIPGAVVLHDFFKKIGYENFQNYIPHRHYEGFGLSNEALDKLKQDEVNLVITIDCGITNVEEVEHAKGLDIDVIITDHHEPGGSLPEAVALVNPKLGDYPFDGLCGAAVAFKLAQAYLNRGDFDMPKGYEKWWLDMVGIATIADMVPLVDENRVLASYGLQVLRKSRRPGLQQLLKKARADQRYLTEDDIGFTIGPRINAASRMDNPEDAFFMLAETDLEQASERVLHLEKLNTERKTTVATMTKELHKRMKGLEVIPQVIVMGNPDWKPSLVGLAANKLAEEFGRPAFIWGKDGNGVYKGSCRAGGGASVVNIMQSVSDIFIEHGGHHAAGGFSVKDDSIYSLGETLNEAAKNLGEELFVKDDVRIDVVITLEDINQLLLKQLKSLSPFGTGNHKPLFAAKGVKPRSVDLFGKTKEHSKIIFQSENGGVEGITFFQTPEQYTKEPKVDIPCTVIGYVEQSFFMGRMQTRLRVVDII